MVQGAKWIAKGIQSNKSLEVLNIKGNIIGDDGLILIAQSLKDAPQLKQIYSDKTLLKSIPNGAGLYIFFEKSKPIYIGISRNVKKRLRNHGWGKLHNQATLAYLISEHKLKYKTKRSKLKHEQVMATQQRLRCCRVVTIPVNDDDPFLLYFMEIYLAGCLKTKWNSFRTH